MELSEASSPHMFGVEPAHRVEAKPDRPGGYGSVLPSVHCTDGNKGDGPVEREERGGRYGTRLQMAPKAFLPGREGTVGGLVYLPFGTSFGNELMRRYTHAPLTDHYEVRLCPVYRPSC